MRSPVRFTFYAVLVSCACFLIQLPIVAHAFSLRPAIIELAADPGKEIHGVIEVANDEREAKDFYVTVQRFLPADHEGRQQFLPVEERIGLPSWIEIPATVRLRSGESKRVPFTVRVPQEAAPGGYYAAIFFAAQEGNGVENIAVGSRTGSLLLFTVQGDAVADIHVASLEPRISRSFWWPSHFEIRLKNEGTIHSMPRGFVMIRNLFGQVSHLIPMNTDGARVLPQSTRTIRASWDQGVVASGFWSRLKQEVKLFGLGYYRAEVVLSDDTTVSGSSTSFVIWPWRLGLVVALGLLVLLYLVRHLRQRSRL